MTPNAHPLVLVRNRALCPRCGADCPRHSIDSRRVRDVGGQVMVVEYSKHYCSDCRRHFSVNDPDLVPKHGRYSMAIRREAIRLFTAGKTIAAVSERLQVPLATIHDWAHEAIAKRIG